MIQWHIVDSAEYRAGTKSPGHLYFLKDTREIYRGEENFSESVILYNGTLPTKYAINRLYIDSTSLAGHINDGTGWKSVIKPVEDTFDAESGNPVSAKAIAAYVAAEIAKVSTSGDVINALSWDSAEHILTVTKGDTTTTDITFDGLGVNLTYVSATGALQLLDASGNLIGDPINLPQEQFVTAGEYDAVNKQIILYFDAEKTNSVTIDASALVDVYTGEETTSASVSVSADNKISATVKISSAEGNTIILKDDGIYVAAPDLSGYMERVPDAVEGNLVTLDASGQVVDSGISVSDLKTSSATIFQGATLEEAIGDATPKAGDIAIVSVAIGETGKVQKTAHQYDGINWVAFDGNYSAENVYFPEDLTTTAAIGNITLTNGQATIAAAGKNLVDVWNSIFIKEKNPTSNTAPYVSITANNNKAYEVGDTVTPTYTASFNAGKYQYGPATGITVESWSVTASDKGETVATKDTNSGSFDTIEVADDTNYIITASATHTEGAIPVTNTGNEYPSAKFAAGTKSKASAAITGFRRAFWGYSTTAVDPSALTSNDIRGLQNKSDAAVAVGSVIPVSYVAGARAVIFAYPATIADCSSVIDEGGMKAEIVKAHTTNVDVEGLNGHTAVSYKVWVYTFADPGASNDNTYTVTI